MPMQSEISENDGRLIEGIQKQSKEIINEIEKCPSETLDKIKHWVSQIDFESLLGEKIQLLATIIDTIHCYSKNKSNEKNETLIESCLCNLLNNLSQLSNDEILAIVSYLKAYIKTNNSDAEFELEKFIGEFAQSKNRFNLLSDIRNQIGLSYEKSKLSFFNTFKAPSNNVPIAELILKADAECQFYADGTPILDPESVNDSQAEIKKLKSRKKIKSRTIIFDDDSGIGYDQYSSHWYFKEVTRLSDINLEVELSSRIKKKILQEELLRGELDRLDKIEENLELYSNRLEKKIKLKKFELFASPKEKEARQLYINESIKNTKKIRESCRNDQKRQARAKKIGRLLDPIVFLIQERINQYRGKSSNNNKHALGIKLPFFEVSKNDFVKGFLATINYNHLKELINYAEDISISIGHIKKNINKIDNFFKSFGFSSNYIAALDDSQRKLKGAFTKDAVFNFLDLSVNLYRQRTLNLDNNYCLLNIREQKEKIEFSESVFLRSFISSNKPEKIFELLSDNIKNFFNRDEKHPTLIRNIHIEKKGNIFKKWFNYFSGKYFFLNLKHKRKFVRKFFLNSQEYLCFETIQTKLTKLKLWHFILVGINPFNVIKKNFKELLAKKLFLNLIEEEFNKFDKEPNIKNIDAMYSILYRLNSSNISDKSQSISLSLMNVFSSRKEIIDNFNQLEEVKELLEKVSNLTSHATWCANEFSKLLNACRREIEKISSSLDLDNKIFFKKHTARESCCPNNNTSNLSCLSVGRGIN